MQTLLKTRARCLPVGIVGWRRFATTLLGGLASVLLLVIPDTLFAQNANNNQVEVFAAGFPLAMAREIPKRILTSLKPEPTVNQCFGNSVAIAGKTIVIGEPKRTVNGQIYVGEGYVYVEPAGGWGSKERIPVATLTASDAKTQTWPFLGYCVAISGDTIVLGCAFQVNNGSYSREAYVYVKPSAGWTTTTESARLQSPSPRFQLGGNGAVAIDGDTIIAECVDTAYTGVGTAGAVAVYVKPAHGWTGDIMPIAVLTDGGLNDSLGSQVAISGDTIAVAAPEATVGSGGPGSGDIQIYEKPVGGWVTTATPTATLLPSDPDAGFLGYSLGISGDTIVAGCPYALVKGQYAGAAYVFQRQGKHWHNNTQTAKLGVASLFVLGGTPAVGIAVAIDGAQIAVGANGASPPDGAFYGGELFIYKRSGGSWRSTLQPNAAAYDPNAGNTLQLGISAGISGDTFVTGAWAPDSQTLCLQGAVYIFQLP
jgi:hypothetical protein